MRDRAAKRQKRSHARSVGVDESLDGTAQSDGSKEDESYEPGRKADAKKSKTNKLEKSPAKSRKLVSLQKEPESGLRQAQLSFAKAAVNPPKLREKTPTSTQESTRDTAELEDDLIQDEDSDDAPVIRRRVSGRQVPTNGTGTGAQESQQPRRNSKLTLFSTQSLSKQVGNKQAESKERSKDLVPEDPAQSLPWALRYPPRNLEELGVHKRKVADVSSWIDNVLNGYERKRLLVLRGPSGSGKTAMVQALSASLGFRTLEWRNPLTTATALGEYRSGTASFEDFLSRGQRYASLNLHASGVSPTEEGNENTPDLEEGARRIILMEEDPHVFSSSNTSLRNFRDSLLRYLLAEETLFGAGGIRAQGSLRNRPPIVMIISESAGPSAGSLQDSLTAHRLLGPDILQHPRVTVIEFNPVATTILTKALDLVAAKAAHDGVNTAPFSPAILHALAEGGDLRAAIAALEFLCRQTSNGTVRQRPPPKRSKAKSTILTTAESNILKTLTPRNPALDLFHAIGKVVYNKRRPSSADSSVLESEVDIDRLLDDAGHDPATFVAALHENYALSCAGETFTDTLNDCIDTLSTADILGIDTSFTYGALDTAQLRQSDLAAHVAVAGLLDGLPYPVQRKAAGTYAGGRDAFKMFYPESVRLRGRIEDVRDVARRWVGGAPSDQAPAQPMMGSMHDFILTELPYLALLAGARASPGPQMAELELMGKLENSAWAGPEEKAPLWGKKGGQEGRNRGKTMAPAVDDDEMGSFIQGVDEKWVLSDDDIVDD